VRGGSKKKSPIKRAGTQVQEEGPFEENGGGEQLLGGGTNSKVLHLAFRNKRERGRRGVRPCEYWEGPRVGWNGLKGRGDNRGGSFARKLRKKPEEKTIEQRRAAGESMVRSVALGGGALGGGGGEPIKNARGSNLPRKNAGTVSLEKGKTGTQGPEPRPGEGFRER